MRLAAPVTTDGLRKSTQMRFGGYNALGTEGEICAMVNLTDDYFPELASRPPRKIVGTVTSPRGMAGGTELIWIDGRDLHVDDVTVADLLAASDAQRQIARIGDYITIWPDKVWYDTVAGTHGSLEASVTTAANTAHFSSEASPAGRSDTCNCLDLGASASGFKPGDAVTISGCTWRTGNNESVIVREVSGNKLYFYDETFGLDRVLVCDAAAAHDAGTYTVKHDDLPEPYHVTLTAVNAAAMMEIRLDGILHGETAKLKVTDGGTTAEYTMTAGASGPVLGDEFHIEDRAYTEAGAVTVARTVPALEFVFEHANRLWGCEGASIRGSALGSPFNWEVYDGTASDSWAVETGSGGAFTGAISYGGYPRFFKEERVYTLYGDYPEEYQLQEHTFLGVNAGSARSLVTVNGLLFYLSKAGPCIFQGGAPTRIADAFGIEHYKNGVGGTDGKKYYLSMQDSADAWHLFVYEPGRSMWMREDGLHALDMAGYNTELYCIAADGTMLILGRPHIVPAGAVDEDEIPWEAEFGDITGGSPNRKHITKVQLRLELEEKTWAEVYMQYDSDGVWRMISDFQAKRKKSVVLPVIPRRPDHFRIRIRGTGAVRISSLAIETAQGSDRR